MQIDWRAQLRIVRVRIGGWIALVRYRRISPDTGNNCNETIMPKLGGRSVNAISPANLRSGFRAARETNAISCETIKLIQGTTLRAEIQIQSSAVKGFLLARCPPANRIDE
jgi:hypothetical protein